MAEVWPARHGCLLLRFCDMLPFKQPRVNLFGTCCSLAEDPEAFMILICFPLCPLTYPPPSTFALQRGKTVGEVQWGKVTTSFTRNINLSHTGVILFPTLYPPHPACPPPPQDPGHRVLEQLYIPITTATPVTSKSDTCTRSTFTEPQGAAPFSLLSLAHLYERN